MDTLSIATVSANLGTCWLGRTVVYHAVTGSTNDDARQLALAGTPEGTLVLADQQTAGRGRLQRRWITPPGQALLFSLVFYPCFAARDAFQLTMLASLGCVRGIAEEAGLQPTIKWPNDLLLEKRKLAGILSEMGQTGDRLYAIVGIGINTNVDWSAVPELQAQAISLSQILGHPVPRVPLLQAILRHIETLYDRLRAGQSAYEQWREHLGTLGQRVRVATPEQVLEGLASDVEPDGTLLLTLDNGRTERILVGDVESLRN